MSVSEISLVYKLMKDYGNLYSGYKFSVGTDLKLMNKIFRYNICWSVTVESVVMAVKKKETRTLFIWVQMIVCLFMFLSTQTHGQQHLLLYIPSLIMLTLISIRHITKEWALVGISLLALVHSVNVYIPRTQPHNIQEIKHMALIPMDFSMLPVSRDDTDEIIDVKEKNRHNRL